ncbi:hypothetical protein QA089_004612 [Meyerozyma guilliermondii]
MALVKFNAGKVQYDETTHKCTPLPHKGVISIKVNSDEEGFYDFTWTPKSSNGERDELLIIPGDVSFKPVKSCTTGRVVALTFLSSGAKNLYWFQDVGDDEQLNSFTTKDDEIIRKINELIAVGDDDDDEEQATAEPPAETHTENAPLAQESTSSFSGHISQLGDVLSPENISQLVHKMSPEAIEQVFGPHLPEGTAPTADNVMEVVTSSFFRQSLTKFSDQLDQNDGTGMLLAQAFGIEYKGEGLTNWLQAMREKKEEEKKR